MSFNSVKAAIHRIAALDWRDWRGFKVRSSRCLELRTSSRAFLACLARQCVALADIFNSLLRARPTLPFLTRRRRCGQMRGRRPGKTGGVFAGIH